jgi:hypothetical protein
MGAMDVLPQGPRYLLDRGADGFQVTIPARRNWFLILFLMVWLCGWAAGESSAIAQLAGHPFPRTKPVSATFLSLWLVFWTCGGVAACLALLWNLAGREIITLSATKLVHRTEILGAGRSRSYQVGDIKSLRASTDASSGFHRSGRGALPFGAGGIGSLVFDYGARTIRMAPSLDEAEAKMLVTEFSTRLKG